MFLTYEEAAHRAQLRANAVRASFAVVVTTRPLPFTTWPAAAAVRVFPDDVTTIVAPAT